MNEITYEIEHSPSYASLQLENSRVRHEFYGVNNDRVAVIIRTRQITYLLN